MLNTNSLKMKYYRLYITTTNNFEIYSKITEILGVKPIELETEKNSTDLYNLWTYSIDEEDEAPYYDFINNFLDIVEPKFTELKKIGIKKKHITFWMNYEYDQQCGMEFHPKEMKRLGKSGIIMCIDCWQKGGVIEL
jgi:hypothetical protein